MNRSFSHRNLELFTKYNLVLDVTCYQWSLPALAEVAAKFPKNTFGTSTYLGLLFILTNTFPVLKCWITWARP
jgi:hypothetical protein